MPPRFNFSFELTRALSPLQRPIHHATASFLDFLVPSHFFNVQSATLRLPFWTSSCLPTSSTSNPPRFDFLFGLPRAFPPLQRPIRHTASTVVCEKLRHISSHDTYSHTPTTYFNVVSSSSNGTPSVRGISISIALSMHFFINVDAFLTDS